MSTTGIDSWAVDLADVTTIYPLQGWEPIMAVILFVIWIAWHIWQVKHENSEYKEIMDKHANDENIRKAIDGG